MASNAFTAGFNMRKQRTGSDTEDTEAPANSFAAGAASGARANQKRRSSKALKSAQSPTGLQTEQPTLNLNIPSMKHGGRVKKTGLIYAHRNEVVIPAKNARKMGGKRSGRRKASGGGKTTIKP